MSLWVSWYSTTIRLCKLPSPVWTPFWDGPLQLSKWRKKLLYIIATMSYHCLGKLECVSQNLLFPFFDWNPWMVNCVLVSQSFKLFEWSMTGQPVTNSQPYRWPIDQSPALRHGCPDSRHKFFVVQYCENNLSDGRTLIGWRPRNVRGGRDYTWLHKSYPFWKSMPGCSAKLRNQGTCNTFDRWLRWPRWELGRTQTVNQNRQQEKARVRRKAQKIIGCLRNTNATRL